MADNFKQLLEYATSQGYRTNVIKPLIMAIIIALFGVLGCLYLGYVEIAKWCFILLVVFVVAFLIAYFVCLFKDPNLLRSEKYNLEKTALEKATIRGSSTMEGQIHLPNYECIQLSGTNNHERLETKNIADIIERGEKS